MRKRVLAKTWLAVFLCLAWSAGPATAGHQGHKPAKRGILLVAFGTSVPEAQKAFTNVEHRVSLAFPGVALRWAFTSHTIRHKLAARGKPVDSVACALAGMLDDGFTHVAVQSLHTVAGEEFHDLRNTVPAFEIMHPGFERILVGLPLLGTQADLERTVEAILTILPGDRKKSEPVVLMGHGTPHPANAFYSALNWQLQQKDENVVTGTVEGYPELSDVAAWLDKRKAETVWLMPFMSVAGDHALNDMAGPQQDSWKSVLEAKGYRCRPVLKGTGEYGVFVDIWVNHLKAVFGRL